MSAAAVKAAERVDGAKSNLAEARTASGLERSERNKKKWSGRADLNCRPLAPQAAWALRLTSLAESIGWKAITSRKILRRVIKEGKQFPSTLLGVEVAQSRRIPRPRCLMLRSR